MDDISNHKCFICGCDISLENQTDEHIILNAIGGRLHSYNILCKKCNNSIGGDADAALANDLSFITDMLQISRTRKTNHNQIMLDEDGHEIIVEEAGRKLKLRKPYKDVQKNLNETRVNICARNKEELNGLLNGLKRDNVLSEDQAKEIMDKANVSKHRSVLSTQFSISSKAFPSIIKSAVDFWVYKTGDIDRIKHLIPYIQGEKTCEDILYLYLFKGLPYPTEKEQATHMIHIEGSKSTGLLYALMEYYGIYTYIVVLDSDYYDEDINMTYAYDPVSSKVIDRKFSLPLTLSHLDDFIKMPYDEYASYFDYIERRINSVLTIWQRKSDEEALNKVIENAFSSIPEGTIIDDSTLDKIVKEIYNFFESKIKQSSGKDK